MARSETYTLIPLDTIAYILGIDPLHFNGVVSSTRPERDFCDDMWAQYEWQQAGKISRNSLAEVLHYAEKQVARLLGYYPVPTWIEDEEHVLQTPARVENYNLSGVNSRMYPKSIRSDYGMIQKFGVRAKSFIDTVAIDFFDNDNDGYWETARVEIDNTTITDRTEIRVYYTSQSGSDAWEIRPAYVFLAGETVMDTSGLYLEADVEVPQVVDTGKAVIIFRREQVIKATVIGQLQAPDSTFRAVDGDDDDNFEMYVDVYRVYTDPSDHGSFVTTYSSTTAPGALTEESAALSAADAKRGFVQYERATWDADNEKYTTACFTLGREPDKIKINYVSGLPYSNPLKITESVDPMWARAIIYYALTLLDTEICGCSNVVSTIDRMRTDLAVASQERYIQVSPDDLVNPLNTTRAGLQLWRLIRQNRLSFAR